MPSIVSTIESPPVSLMPPHLANHTVAPPDLLPTIVHHVVPLSVAQIELLCLHSHFAHMSLTVIQSMLKADKIKSMIQGATSCALPKCASCLYAKMRSKP
jgi:hypothetical protein